MNENEFDLTARAWLDDGPNRMSDRALLSALDEIHTTRQRRVLRPAWRPTPVNSLIRLATAAVLMVSVGLVAINVGPATDAPPAASPTSSPSDPTASGGMWPQSNLEQVRAAQERADAGDPDSSWQLGARMADEDTSQVDAELVDRFMREVIGWESYKFYETGEGTVGWNDLFNRVEGSVTGQRYLRCARGRTNPLYPEEACAPTLDDLRYETVIFDLAQLDRQGADGIWVVRSWSLSQFSQADPSAVEAQAREHLGDFLAARIAGRGAEGYVTVDGQTGVPLLYATTAGAPYERYEIGRLDAARWPGGLMTMAVRLFADDNATEVTQAIVVSDTYRLVANSTTENGQPVSLPYTSADGDVTVSAPGPWSMWWPEESHQDAVGVWFGLMKRGSQGDTRVEFVDPVAHDAWCAANGGSPLLSAPADAAAIAQQLIADPDFETSSPAAARIGGLDALSMDVALAPGGEGCGIGRIEISRWVHSLQPGLRLRLYLVDLPRGMSVRTLAITVVAPEERFDDVIAETGPIIESIEFHADS